MMLVGITLVGLVFSRPELLLQLAMGAVKFVPLYLNFVAGRLMQQLHSEANHFMGMDSVPPSDFSTVPNATMHANSAHAFASPAQPDPVTAALVSSACCILLVKLWPGGVGAAVPGGP